MKAALSSFDISAAVRELQPVVGGHIDKVYHPSIGHLVLALRVQGEGKSFIHFHVGKWLYKSSESGDMPQEPSGFARMLRKRVSGARISSVRQQGFDRIVVLTLEKDGTHELVLELFGKGNAILVKDGVIVQPLTSHTWKHRDVKAKRAFEYPPPIPDPTDMSPEDLVGIAQGSDSDVVRTIATRLNLGGSYSEEACARSGVDPHGPAKAMDADVAGAVLAAIAAIRADIESSGAGFVISSDSGLIDVVPVRMSTYSELQHEEYGSFSEAVQAYVGRVPESKEEKRKDAEAPELGRLRRQLAQQEAAVSRLNEERAAAQTAADYLFTKYAEVERALLGGREVLEGGRDLKDVVGASSIDKATGLMKIDIDGSRLVLDVRGSVESNAQRYYENSKKARSKLEGLMQALEETREAVSGHIEKADRREEVERTRRLPTKRFWFERFRWFVSSEGAVVMGGKDARSNDLLVKKHLDAGDRYAHADVHGAPSVVVKMRDGISEATLVEACEFAVATSRAWNAKIGSAAGYWVLPEQVSKTPQSGEFLARGAFVIRGKRNYTDKIQILLGVGEIVYEGERKVMAGPVRAVKARCDRYVVMRPGETSKELVAKRLAEIFQVPIEEVQSVMPPGDLQVVEQSGVELRI
jgi:predicted ribosome quality control (RQC) complex YloA/Tae2 family protein